MRLCPDPRFRSTRLFLAFWAADLFEHWNLRCMIQGNCISCKCPKDRLRLGEIIPVDADDNGVILATTPRKKNDAFKLQVTLLQT